MFGIFSRASFVAAVPQISSLRFVLRFTKTTGHSKNTHRSNRAKKSMQIIILVVHLSHHFDMNNFLCNIIFVLTGLFHGKDVRFGNSIAHSGARTKRKWSPNVIDKRVWSDSLDQWVKFKMTTRALKEIDNIGGIDNYIMALDKRSVNDSNYITKMRGLIGSAMFHQGILAEKYIRRLGYHKNPPEPPEVKKVVESDTK